jgi:hypothetical protein
MDNKRVLKNLPEEEVKGFEEFIEGQPDDSGYPARNPKKDTSIEHFTFLTNDSMRLMKIKELIAEKMPFATKHEQGQQLINGLEAEKSILKKNLFELFKQSQSGYQKSVGEIFNSFFGPSKG